MDANMVIAVYRPKPGKTGQLCSILERHLPLLRELGLATERRSLVMRSVVDGSIIEIFEWVSDDAVNVAHEHPRVLAYWDELKAVCNYTAPGALREMSDLFPHFEILDDLAR
ncbi:MAG: hypothetical protein Kow0074_22910 [Candidatus Zixiibacteriota bacterium]